MTTFAADRPLTAGILANVSMRYFYSVRTLPNPLFVLNQFYDVVIDDPDRRPDPLPSLSLSKLMNDDAVVASIMIYMTAMLPMPRLPQPVPQIWASGQSRKSLPSRSVRG